MVDHVPNDSVDAKSRFDDVRDVPLARFLDGLLVWLDMFFVDLNDFTTR